MDPIVDVPAEDAIWLGAYQRRCELGAVDVPVRRRASGGAAVRVGPGVVVVRLEVGDVPPDKILNRAVRPLLRALTKAAGRPVSYFGRDWIACGARPVGMVAFAHDAATNRATLEAFVSARTSAWLGERASHRGHAPATLDVDPDRIVDALGASALSAVPTEPARDEPPWEATLEEAIGIVAAGRDADGLMRVGGELMASRDAIARLEAALAEPAIDVDAAIDAALAAPGVATFGVRSLASIRDVALAARQPHRA